jgi:hypothetical protein
LEDSKDVAVAVSWCAWLGGKDSEDVAVVVRRHWRPAAAGVVETPPVLALSSPSSSSPRVLPSASEK